MRLLFFILLLANAVVLGYFLLQPEGRAIAARAPLHPDAIRVQGELAAAPAASAQGICLEWSGLTEANLATAREALEKLGIADKLVLASTSDYWVHIPPLKTRGDADKKLAELKALGIEDVALVEEEGKWRNAVSLAAFASAEEAEFHLKQLRDKGVKSAKVAERHAPATSITVIEVDDALREKLDRLRTDFDRSELKPVGCKLR